MFVRATWLCILLALSISSNAIAQRDTNIPPQQYYFAFGPYFEGDYATALEAFDAARRGGVRSTEGQWVDSICYHTMIGECYYRIGDIAKASEQYDAALKLAVFHSNWMLRVEFPQMVEPSASAVRGTIVWGQTTRNTRLPRVPDRMATLVGRLDNDQVIRRGGIVAAPEFYLLNVKEIARCTALAIFRRLEIMGPVCQHDAFTAQLVATLSRRPTRPNHWSQAWISCQLGMAYASTGKTQQAVSELTKSLVLAGQYDHELTALSLLELGRLAFEQGQHKAAATYFLEATFAAAAFDQFDLMQDAFRGGLVTHLVSGQKGLYPPLALAAPWARRNSRALQAELSLLAAENAAAMGETAQAIRLLAQTRQAVGTREMRSGMFGARFNYQSALVDFQRGNLADGARELASAIQFQKASSRWLFQIGLADRNYAAGTISQRVTDLLFDDVLREPVASDWAVEPMETLAVTVTPHLLPLQHWFEVALTRNDQPKAFEISDRIRRHRFYSTLPVGGRLLALRWILEAPDGLLSQQAIMQRQDLLGRYPNYAKAAAQSVALRNQLAQLPLVTEDLEQSRQQAKLFEQLAETSAVQELILREIALRREPSEFVFPPLYSLKEIQESMTDDQLVLAYLAADQYIAGFALSKEKHAVWRVDSPAKVAGQIAELLEQMGLSDRKVTMDAKKLKDRTWMKGSAELLRQLSNKAENWDAYSEVVIVPDGPLWYLPFEALHAGEGENYRPLLSRVQIRYVPTISMVGRDTTGRKPNARTAVITGKMFPGQDPQITADAFEEIRRAVPGTSRFSDRLPGPSAYVAAACDRAIVLSDLEQMGRGPYGWSPMQLDRGKAGGNLDSWMALPWQGPSQIVLPGFHTPAEAALKQGGTGSETFLNVCGLMASGARSVLLSRWPVGGQSTFDLVREYAQELPFTPAAEAWQRSVRLAQNNLVDPQLEPRLNATGLNEDFTAKHPFFWAGYMLVDTGSGPVKDAP
ncbi:MAG: CHAT domain-containing protein [Planctomycetes bacterium]|nr:CHAT domain-containing protein [Planctomycetota bacterium]MBL7043122.1 CHAT domain-containing protein [Pirellulaceae bacterium]